MSKDSTKNFPDLVPDFGGKTSLSTLDVSSNVLSLVNTVASSAIDLHRMDVGIEEMRLKTQLLADSNEKTFAIHNKVIDRYFDGRDAQIANASKAIDYGIEKDDRLVILQGLNAMVTLATHETLPQIPDFAKSLDNGEMLQLGYEEENKND